MKRWDVLFVLFSLVLGGLPLWAEVDLFLAPNGGWAEMNTNRVISLPDGTSATPTLNNAVIDLIQRTKNGGTIKIAMYAFSDADFQQILIDAAFTRNIKVKVILDGVADWTKEPRTAFIDRVKEALAKEKKWNKNFQVKEIEKETFKARGRTRTLDDGKEIFGTMHEKFGVFYQPKMKIPFDAFAGSSNLSFGSDQLFSENRFIFRNDPAVSRQFAEEFARLWNEYGKDAIGNAESEPYIPADPITGGVRVIFNGEPLDEERYHQIDEALLDMLGKVRFKDGTIDIFMFSFTHFQLAQRLLEIAQRFPKVRIRILMDQSTLLAADDRPGILGPYLDERIAELGLKNFEIRYKWRANIFSWELPEGAVAIPQKSEKKNRAPDEIGTVDLSLDGLPTPQHDGEKPKPEAKKGEEKVAAIHWRNLILHHKVLMVNNNLMAAGSYNWSSSAERRNLENVMIFNGDYPGQQVVIDRMQADFNTLWNSEYKKGPFSEKISGPQVITGKEGREVSATIIKTLEKPDMKPIMDFLDKKDAGEPFKAIVKATSLNEEAVQKNLDDLAAAGLLFSRKTTEDTIHGLSD